jgi:hypothetical protein
MSLVSFSSTSQKLQKREQIGLSLRSETNVESLIVERDDITQTRGRTVVKVKRASRQGAQDRTLELPDIGPRPGDQGPPGIGDLRRRFSPKRVYQLSEMTQ